MNTSNLNASAPRSVGQLDKTPIIPLNSSSNKALTVGRQQSQTSRVSERTHKGAPAPDFMEQSDDEKQDLTAMLHLNKLFSDLLSRTKVVFHNVLYVEQIQEGFLPHESDIFLGFVRTFAQFRCRGHFQEENIILTNDDDFYLAFKLMKKRKLSDYTDIKPKNRTKILDLIRLKFPNRTFTPKTIAQELFYNYAFIHRVLAMLILEREIEFVKDFQGEKHFRLREKPLVTVSHGGQ
jgi:hypothetical protein